MLNVLSSSSWCSCFSLSEGTQLRYRVLVLVTLPPSRRSLFLTLRERRSVGRGPQLHIVLLLVATRVPSSDCRVIQFLETHVVTEAAVWPPARALHCLGIPTAASRSFGHLHF